MLKHIILVDKLKDWRSDFPDLQVVQVKDYLQNAEFFKLKSVRIINLARSYRYLSNGYYCSLLAEARKHKIIPPVRTMVDVAARAVYSMDIEDLDAKVRKVLRKYFRDKDETLFHLVIYFGQCEYKELQSLARQLFEMFPVPMLRVDFKRKEAWQVYSVKPLHLDDLDDEQAHAFTQAVNRYVGSPWVTQKKKSYSRYDMAILYNPQEKLPPSNTAALNKFIRIGKKLGIAIDLIEKKDYPRLAEYDALFIRETTNINHHTYRFAKKAESEGMVVIDDPNSIVKCTNKVYLAELLEANHVPTLRTKILHKGSKADLSKSIGYPVVLKIPDGSFSRGVFKAKDAAEAKEITGRLFKESDLILAQEYRYTSFDWRVGILNQQPLFVCKYFMSRAHWQIVKHGPSGKSTEGGYEALPIDRAPQEVINTALAATRLIGDGLYGVDLKQDAEGVYVIEVNDNPNLESGVEDLILKDGLYQLILSEFIRRLESRKIPVTG